MNNKIGEIKTNIEGRRSIVKEYNGYNDVTITWEEDNSDQKIDNYHNWKTGTVLKNSAKNIKNTLLGMVFTDSNGDQAKVISCEADNTVTMIYMNGDTVSGIPIDSLSDSLFNRENEYINKEESLSDDKLTAERIKTEANVRYLLNKYHRCALIRPCGFGKTYLAKKFFKSPKYNKCLFLYPNSDAKDLPAIKGNHISKQIDIQTYSWLISQNKKNKIESMDYDLIVFDEMQYIGGDENGKGAYETYKAVTKLINTHPHTHFLGMTATPFRMDGIDVVGKVFLNHTCYPYTEEDAFEDGIILNPNYYYCVGNVTKKIREAVGKNEKQIVEMSREDIAKALELSEEDMNRLDAAYLDKNIKELCEKFVEDKSYMRFIAYYLENKDIEENREKVEGWFKKAYPEHEVCSIVVTSASEHDLADVEALPTVPSDPKYKGRIDIIFNCEILCHGYHSELISGLILDRKTKSLQKYTQMIGRLLCCGSKKKALIIDVVDNIHADFVFNTSSEEAPQIATPFIAPNKSELTTFAEIKKAYPHAINWDVVNKCNKKAVNAEKIVNDMITDSSASSFNFEKETKTINPVKGKKLFFDDTPATNVVNDQAGSEDGQIKENISFDREQIAEEAKEIIKKDNLSWIQAGGLIQNLFEQREKEYKQTVISVDHNRMPQKTIPSLIADSETPKEDERKTTDMTTPNIASKEPKAENTMFSEAESLGFDDWTYHYNPNTGELYRKKFEIVNKQADFAEAINYFHNRLNEESYNKVINKINEVDIDPEYKKPYTDYSQVDKKSIKYKLFKAASEICRVDINWVLKRMIEGVA